MKELISESALKRYALVDVNMAPDTSFFGQAILAAQVKELQPRLGDDLYDWMQAQADLPFPTAQFDRLSLKIAPALAWWAYLELLPTLFARMTEAGYNRLIGEAMTPANKVDMQSARVHARDNAEAFWRDAERYLNDNSASYPLWRGQGNCCDSDDGGNSWFFVASRNRR